MKSKFRFALLVAVSSILFAGFGQGAVRGTYKTDCVACKTPFYAYAFEGHIHAIPVAEYDGSTPEKRPIDFDPSAVDIWKSVQTRLKSLSQE